MSIYKIFPEKSATLFSFYPYLNTGLDEVLECSTFFSTFGTNEVSRPVLQFPIEDIDTAFSFFSTSSWDAYLKLSLTDASALPLNYNLYCNTLAKDWNKGTGRTSNSPIVGDGVSWAFTNQSGSNPWVNGTFPSGTTGSYNNTIGGGVWLTSSIYQATQSFSSATSLDIEIKITETVSDWKNRTISNYGVILKNDSNLEFSTASKFELKYYSDNTHTIYPPCLEIRWDDSVYNTGSLSVINNDSFVVTFGNNKGEFQQGSVQSFRVNARDEFPARVFQTSSVYLNNKALPSSSYWTIKDLSTDESVIDYDDNYTKISCDPSGSYFNIYMNGLEPNRYYKVQIRVVLDNGEIVAFDNDDYFKVSK